MPDFNERYDFWPNQNTIPPEDFLTMAQELRRVYRDVWPRYRATLTPEEQAEIVAGCQRAWPDNSDEALPLYTAQIVISRFYEWLGAWQDNSDSAPDNNELLLLCRFFEIGLATRSDMSIPQSIRMGQWKRDLKLQDVELSISPEHPALLEAWRSLSGDDPVAPD